MGMRGRVSSLIRHDSQGPSFLSRINCILLHRAFFEITFYQENTLKWSKHLILGISGQGGRERRLHQSG